MIARQILFLFSALGAVNGAFLAVFFLTRRPRRLADCFLGALLLAVGVRTAKSTLLFFNPGIALEFRQLGLSACLLIGPLTYLYIRHHLAERDGRQAGSTWRWHLALAAFVIAIGVGFPYASYPYVWDRSSYGIHALWFAYLLASGRVLWRERGSLTDATGGRISRNSLLLVSVFFGSCLILLAYATTPFTSYIVGALSFTFSIHIAVLVFLLRREAQDKYRNNRLSEDQALALVASLEAAMVGLQLHLNPNLTLAQLAKRAGCPSAAVSQVLNDKLDKSFNLYVNEFRIAEAKKLLTDEPELKLETVAERCGFNSSSTFFAAFKKIAGQTPARFRAEFSQSPKAIQA